MVPEGTEAEFFLLPPRRSIREKKTSCFGEFKSHPHAGTNCQQFQNRQAMNIELSRGGRALILLYRVEKGNF